MRTTRWSAWLALGMFGFGGCGGSGGSGGQPAPSGTVSGRVTTDSSTPVSGASVSCGGVTATSDADGRYTLANVPAGSQTLTVTASGCQDHSSSVTVPAGGSVTADVTLTAKQQKWVLAGYAVGKTAGNDSNTVSVPEVIRLANGTYRMYYGGFDANGSAIRYAESTDGSVWTVRGTVLSGVASTSDREHFVNNPSVVELPDGRYRLYYTANPLPNSPPPTTVLFHARSAISDDGVNFTREGVVIEISSVDPSSPFDYVAHGAFYTAADGTFVCVIDAEYNGEIGPCPLVLGTSSDGRTWGNFRRLYNEWHDPIVVRAADGFRLYASYLLDYAGMALSADGLTWPSSLDQVAFVDQSDHTLNESTGYLGDYGAVVLANGQLRIFSAYGSPSTDIIFFDPAP